MNPSSSSFGLRPEDSVLKIKGVGKARAAQLEKLGASTVGELVTLMPRYWEDRTVMRPIAELMPGEPACFFAMVAAPPRSWRSSGGLDVMTLLAADETDRVTLTFFNRSYDAAKLTAGRSFYFYGTLSVDASRREIVNPEYESPDSPGVRTRCVIPVYPQTAGLSSVTIGKTIRGLLPELLPQLPDLLPAAILEKYGFENAEQSWKAIHLPKTAAEAEAAVRRLSYEELFLFALGMQLQRRERLHAEGPHFSDPELSGFFDLLPFSLTGAQERVIREIRDDMMRDTPMSRLVQGDVGSGKTMCAAAAVYLAVRNGFQAAMMAPTEILARQQYNLWQELFAPLGVPVILLTGALSAKERGAALAQMASEEPCIAVGTHSLFGSSVEFGALGLVIVDEQHRFGTGQRAALMRKGQSPHTLVMSATPIPRTLALLLYGELDVSIVDEKPPGRQTVKTYVVDERMRQRVNAFIRRQAEAGHQIFIVCPAVEERETDDLKSAELWAETLRKAIFPTLRVGLLHGRMKGAEKDAIMSAFAGGEYDILVSTTVVEVGVDVPNAVLMIVENAERFGLSQLHQLRGRVGRGSAESWCILFTENRSEDAIRRLKAFASTNDGFRIAEEDLKLRGPGDLLGSRQHGMPALRYTDLATGLTLLQSAAEDAAALPPEALSPALIAAAERMMQRGTAMN